MSSVTCVANPFIPGVNHIAKYEQTSFYCVSRGEQSRRAVFCLFLRGTYISNNRSLTDSKSLHHVPFCANESVLLRTMTSTLQYDEVTSSQYGQFSTYRHLLSRSFLLYFSTASPFYVQSLSISQNFIEEFLLLEASEIRQYANHQEYYRRKLRRSCS